jgi:hypothetical protein
MSSIGARTEADYEIRLTELVAVWEKKNAAEAAALRLVTQRRIGMTALPPADSLRRQVLEREFREEVRKLKNWPSLRAWMRGES